MHYPVSRFFKLKIKNILKGDRCDVCSPWQAEFNISNDWWLVELPVWLTDGFVGRLFGRWKGRWWGVEGGIPNIRKLQIFYIFLKEVGSTSSHIGSHMWQTS